MLRSLKAKFYFFKPFAIVCVLLTLLCCYVLLRTGERGYIIIFVWLKVMVNAIMLYAWKAMKEDDVYFYHNLGISSRSLYISVFLFDFLLFTLLSSLTCFLI